MYMYAHEDTCMHMRLYEYSPLQYFFWPLCRRRLMWVSITDCQNWNQTGPTPGRRGMQSGDNWSPPATSSRSPTLHLSKCRYMSMCIYICVYMYYILVKLPRECISEKIVRGCGREANIARGAAECYITTRDHTQVQSFP